MRRQDGCLYSRRAPVSAERPKFAPNVRAVISTASRRVGPLALLGLFLSLLAAGDNSAPFNPSKEAVEASCASYGKLSRHLSSLWSSGKCCSRDVATGGSGFCSDENFVFVMYDVNNGEGFNVSRPPSFIRSVCRSGPNLRFFLWVI